MRKIITVFVLSAVLGLAFVSNAQAGIIDNIKNARFACSARAIASDTMGNEFVVIKEGSLACARNFTRNGKITYKITGVTAVQNHDQFYVWKMVTDENGNTVRGQMVEGSTIVNPTPAGDGVKITFTPSETLEVGTIIMVSPQSDMLLTTDGGLTHNFPFSGVSLDLDYYIVVQ